MIFILLAAVSPAFAAETAPPQAEQPAKPTTAPAKPAPKPAAKKPAITRTIDAQLSGFTSQDADSLYARLAMDEKKNDRTWYVRGSVNTTATNVKRPTHVLTYRLDSRLEQMRNKSDYTVLTAVTSARDRGSSTGKIRKSGYEFLSYGIGKQFDTKTKGDIGIGLLNVRDEDTGLQPSLVAAIRGRRPLSSKLALTMDILVIQPMSTLRSTKTDSDLGLAYELAPGFFLRLDWQATNLIRSAISLREWDSVLRLSFSFRRTSTSQ